MAKVESKILKINKKKSFWPCSVKLSNWSPPSLLISHQGEHTNILKSTIAHTGGPTTWALISDNLSLSPEIFSDKNRHTPCVCAPYLTTTFGVVPFYFDSGFSIWSKEICTIHCSTNHCNTIINNPLNYYLMQKIFTRLSFWRSKKNWCYDAKMAPACLDIMSLSLSLSRFLHCAQS